MVSLVSVKIFGGAMYMYIWTHSLTKSKERNSLHSECSTLN